MSQNLKVNCVLLMTVVNKGSARKVVKASREAGAEGGTTLMGKGTATRHIQKILGMTLDTEKEIIFTILQKAQFPEVLRAVVAAGKLDRPGYGIAFVLQVRQVAGICHLCVLSEAVAEKDRRDEALNTVLYDLIVTIVNRDHAETVVEASKKAGAEGGTILFGRGTGIHEQAKIFGISIEPEKEIVLTLIDRTKTAAVLEAILQEAELNQPGKGIAFVLEVEQVAGINHQLNSQLNSQMNKQN